MKMTKADHLIMARAVRKASGFKRKPRQTVNLSDRQKERLAGMPSDYRKVTQQAYEGNSRKAALKAKCLDCANWTRKEITLCTAEACPLWPYRPYQD